MKSSLLSNIPFLAFLVHWAPTESCKLLIIGKPPQLTPPFFATYSSPNNRNATKKTLCSLYIEMFPIILNRWPEIYLVIAHPAKYFQMIFVCFIFCVNIFIKKVWQKVWIDIIKSWQKCIIHILKSYTVETKEVVLRGGTPSIFNYFYIAFITFPEVGYLLACKLMISRGGPPCLCIMSWWFSEVGHL